MDYKGWYDFNTVDKDFRTTTKVRFCAAMGPPGGGRTFVTNRYLRHYNILYVEPHSDNSMKSIYQNVMDWNFKSSGKFPYSNGVIAMRDNIVNSTI
jgi:dynein heavy chain